MRFKLRAGIHYNDALAGYARINEHGYTQPFNQNILTVSVLSFINFLVFGLLQVRISELGRCNWNSDWFSQIVILFIY